ncbi:hypothetical protein H9Q10_11560 [Eikenella sp. S3360]|uniref:Leucine-rich repeat domain-containing protein n=1 Tax=Eikenella glucosivorans TaxID=2766967 RepID=A0ABS0NDA6_9NEIS|nr:hypothetical protein [Eikenella glucosivorans]MBH5330299.1 hypothetical protein [Eikenella glucosivorans]
MAGAFSCWLNFWDITHDLDKFYRELPQYKDKIHELDRIQISGWRDDDAEAVIKAILPVLWEEVLQHYPATHLRFFGYRDFDVDWIADFPGLQSLAIEISVGSIRNLEKLAKFERLQTLALEANQGFGSLDFLSGVNPNLQKLYLNSETKSAKSDLSVLARFRQLKTLYVKKLEKNLDTTVAGLPELERLVLRSISKPKNLDFVSGLKGLQYLTLQLCGFENVDAAARLPELKYLQLWRLPKLENLDFVSQMHSLQFLFVETLSGITRFPKVADLQKLRRVKIISCKNLADFSEVAHSRSIREFAIQNATQPDLAIYIPIIENRHIEQLGIGHEKVATQNEMRALAQQHGRERIAVYMYPDFEHFVFE